MTTTRGRDLKRKNFRLDQRTLDRARQVLGTRTETETVREALEMVAFRQEVTEGIRRLAGKGEIPHVFANDEGV